MRMVATIRASRDVALCAGLAMVMAAGIGGCKRTHWTTLSPAKAGFQVELPGVAKMDSTQKKSAGMVLKVLQYAVNRGNDLYTLMITYLPAGSAKRVGAETLLRGSSDGMTTRFGVIDPKNAPTKVDGRPALDVSGIFKLQGRTLRLRARFVAAGDTLYSLIEMGVDTKANTALSERFINSFKLLAAK